MEAADMAAFQNAVLLALRDKGTFNLNNAHWVNLYNNCGGDATNLVGLTRMELTSPPFVPALANRLIAAFAPAASQTGGYVGPSTAGGANLLDTVRDVARAAAKETVTEVVQAAVKKEVNALDKPVVNISHASQIEIDGFCTLFGLTGTVKGPRPAHTAATYTAHTWQQEDEVKESPALCVHFSKELRKFGVPLGDGAKDWTIMDVRLWQKLFSFETDTTCVSGTTDALIVPGNTSGMSALLRMSARVVLDWKTQPAMAKYMDCYRQGVVEGIAGTLFSQHPVLVVFTDCVNQMLVIQFAGTEIVDYSTTPGGSLRTISEGVQVIAQYLLKECEAVTDKIAKSRKIPCDVMRASKRIKAALSGAGAGPIAEQVEAVMALPPEDVHDSVTQVLGTWLKAMT